MKALTSTITVHRGHDAVPGMTLRTQVADRRWWMRFWHWATFRSPPQLVSYVTVIETTATTLTVREGEA